MHSINNKNSSIRTIINKSHSILQKLQDYSESQLNTEPSIRQKTLMFNSRPTTSSPDINKHNSTNAFNTLTHTPIQVPQVNLIKHPLKKKHTKLSIYHTPNITDTTWRIYTTTQPNTTQTNKKYITMTPSNSLQKEYFQQIKKASIDSNKIMHQKKILKGKLFHLLNINFIINDNSFFLMNLNAKDMTDSEKTKIMKHESEYRQKHNVGIIIKNTNDVFENIPITHRYEDYHKSPEQFVKENFNEKEIELFKDDPLYYKLENTPLSKVVMCFKKHLKVAIDEEDMKNNKDKDKLRQKSNKNFPKEKKSKTRIMLMKENHHNVNVFPKVKQYPFHYELNKEYITKLKLLKEDIDKKQMSYTERKQDIEDYKIMHINFVNEINRDKRAYDKQKGLKKNNEKMYIMKIVNNIKRNYCNNK